MKTPQEDVEFRMYPLSRRRADAMSNAIGSAVCNICPLNKEGLCTPEPSRRFTGLIDDAKTYYPSIVIK